MNSDPTPTVPADELRARLGRPGAPVVLDVRWHLVPTPRGRRGRGAPAAPAGEADFDAGHVPGAVFVDLDTELAGPPGPAGRHPLPDPADLQDVLRRAGVGRDTEVVVYDGGDALAAARAWWVLRWAGLGPARVRVLDGGFPAWVAAGGDVSTTSGGARTMGDVAVAGGAMPVLTADRAAALAGGAGVLLDARAPGRFAGEEEPVDPVAGHVPGAGNLPAASLLGPDGRFADPADLAGRLAPALGDGAAGVYCGSGVSAAIVVLAAELAGLRSASDPVALYVGSWSHWTGARRPVATGPA